MPDELIFFITGHRGFPNDPAHEKNFVRLVDAGTGDELRRVYPPRNDTGVPVRWQLDRPREVYLEVVDGDTGAAFAWLGVARFNIGLELFREAAFLSSAAPGGERLTGVLRSREFIVPQQLRFLLAGHGSRRGQSPNGKKYVQLVESGSGRILRKTDCTSGEIAQQIEWDLSMFAGRRARSRWSIGPGRAPSPGWRLVASSPPSRLCPQWRPAVWAQAPARRRAIIRELKLRRRRRRSGLATNSLRNRARRWPCQPSLARVMKPNEPTLLRS
ncbi:MAG: hypothetical protein CM1200mP34_0160 [Verrucomicrobiales bacterium]|nr:MAG: hypothetical protein CM1200mP34_0160 [Verrucomicrobiales bacterium]